MGQGGHGHPFAQGLRGLAPDFVFDLVAVWIEATGVRIDYVLCFTLGEKA